MKILLLGEYSGVHATLAEGLRALGHEVVVASNGDFWRDYPRDIDLSRRLSWWGRISFSWRLMRALRKMRGYDVVQLVNPMFLEIRAEKLFGIYDYLRKHNKRIILDVVGDDYYYPYINTTQKPMRYSDYYIGNDDRCTAFAKASHDDWVGTVKERLNKYIAADCDAIVAGTYEYWLPYSLADDRDKTGRLLKEKLFSVPFPFKPAEMVTPPASDKLRVFIGISKQRSEFKGTDVMLRAAEDLQRKYPDSMELKVANGVPYAKYQHMMDNSDVLLDQLYSYGPGMNGLLALSKGLITFTGGEPEHYDLMQERDCRPIVNVQPAYESVYNELEQLLLHPEDIAERKRQSREYVLRNYDYVKVAKQYERIYQSAIE